MQSQSQISQPDASIGNFGDFGNTQKPKIKNAKKKSNEISEHMSEDDEEFPLDSLLDNFTTKGGPKKNVKSSPMF